MKVLVLGSGGREHTLAWKIAASPRVDAVLVAPGNPGTATEPGCTNVAIDPTDAGAVLELVRTRGVSLVVIGPEAPLVAGVADVLRAAGVRVVGPGRDGARLEGSKAFAKEIMESARVPTARWARVRSADEIDAFIDGFDGGALVVKADGLAAGKGVIVCDSNEEARQAAHTMLRERTFGEASETLVLEERLDGIETSFIVLTDGDRFVSFPTSQDHKRLLDADRGPNTGGMGAFSPAPFVSEALIAQAEREVIAPTLAELRRRGIDFRGFLYAGLMLTAAGPRVLEFNTRLGDPETQVLLSAIVGDIVPALIEAADGALVTASFGPTRAAAVVVMAAAGYPDSPKKGAEIRGVDAANSHPGVRVFHAGTALRDGRLVVNGGRVLGVTATGDRPDDAVRAAYGAVAEITWDGEQHRTDIGKALRLG